MLNLLFLATPRCWSTYTRQHGVMLQKTVIFILDAVRTYNLILLQSSHVVIISLLKWVFDISKLIYVSRDVHMK
jgi:hypothetical protein